MSTCFKLFIVIFVIFQLTDNTIESPTKYEKPPNEEELSKLFTNYLNILSLFFKHNKDVTHKPSNFSNYNNTDSAYKKMIQTSLSILGNSLENGNKSLPPAFQILQHKVDNESDIQNTEPSESNGFSFVSLNVDNDEKFAPNQARLLIDDFHTPDSDKNRKYYQYNIQTPDISNISGMNTTQFKDYLHPLASDNKYYQYRIHTANFSNVSRKNAIQHVEEGTDIYKSRNIPEMIFSNKYERENKENQANKETTEKQENKRNQDNKAEQKNKKTIGKQGNNLKQENKKTREKQDNQQNQENENKEQENIRQHKNKKSNRNPAQNKVPDKSVTPINRLTTEKPPIPINKNVIHNKFSRYLTRVFNLNSTDIQTIYTKLDEMAIQKCQSKNADKFRNYLQEDGTFTDIMYNDSHSARKHSRRLCALLLEDFEAGYLDPKLNASYYYMAYDMPLPDSTNWWLHVIGTPHVMWPAIVLARGVFPRAILLKILDRYWLNTSFGPVWNPKEKSGSMAGGNLGPRAFLSEIEAVIRGYRLNKVHHQVTEALERELVDRKPWGNNGLRPDGCLHQHNLNLNPNYKRQLKNRYFSQIYNNNYGKELLKNFASLIWLFKDTSLEFKDSIVEGMYSAYIECEQWLFRGQTVEPTSTGRFIDAGRLVTRTGALDAVYRTGLILKNVGKHNHEIESILHRYNHPYPSEEFALIGNRHFFCSDLMAHQRMSFMATIRMISTRTTRPESKRTSGNTNGYFQGDGFLSVLVTTHEYGHPYREVFQVYDWARVPGVTALYTKSIPQMFTSPYRIEHTFNNSSFVGGVSSGNIGLSVMVYDRPTVPLKAKKSWFFFENCIVAIGSNLYLPPEHVTGQNVSTTLNQVLFSGNYTVSTETIETVTSSENIDSYHSPKWLHHDQIGYIFLKGNEDIEVNVTKKYIDNEPIQIFSSWISHSAQPNNESYAYSIFPDVSAEITQQYSMNPVVDVIYINEECHAVCHIPSESIGIVFFEESCQNITSCGFYKSPLTVCVDKPSLLLLYNVTFMFDDKNDSDVPLEIFNYNKYETDSNSYNLYVPINENNVSLPYPYTEEFSLGDNLNFDENYFEFVLRPFINKDIFHTNENGQVKNNNHITNNQNQHYYETVKATNENFDIPITDSEEYDEVVIVSLHDKNEPPILNFDISVADPQHIYDSVNISISYGGKTFMDTINLPLGTKKGLSMTKNIEI